MLIPIGGDTVRRGKLFCKCATDTDLRNLRGRIRDQRLSLVGKTTSSVSVLRVAVETT
jgi:hypothetical protein